MAKTTTEILEEWERDEEKSQKLIKIRQERKEGGGE